MRYLACVLTIWALLVAPGASAESVRPLAAAIATAHPLATEAGEQILRSGGNAFDAAIAIASTLAVVQPYASGLGGGGFFLLHRDDGLQVMLDARERAPLAAGETMYLDQHGTHRPAASIDGPLAAGIPGLPAALVHLAEHFGNLPLAQTLESAIRAAEQGFEIDEIYARLAEFRLAALRASPEARRIFLHDNAVPKPGFRVRQPELAQTLKRIAEKGADGFYKGTTGGLLVSGVRAAGGIWQAQDLETYRAVEREPLKARIRDLEIVTAAPPSSAVILIEMLNMLLDVNLKAMPVAERAHFTVEAMRRAYRDRAAYLGDPDHVEIPLAMMVHPQYAAGLRAGIHPRRATPSTLLPGIATVPREAANTTHFSVLDFEDNRVAATLSINYPFGSGFVVPGTGVLLNDEMDDFSSKPGVGNVYGLIGSRANAIAPGKRMLSSMSPSFLSNRSRIAVLGTPGGSRIPSMVLLATLGFVQGESAQALVTKPRFHHQYLPDTIEFEPGALDAGVQEVLRGFGHALAPTERPYGDMQAIVWDLEHDKVEAASDPRGVGLAKVLEPLPKKGEETLTAEARLPKLGSPKCPHRIGQNRTEGAICNAIEE